MNPFPYYSGVERLFCARDDVWGMKDPNNSNSVLIIPPDEPLTCVPECERNCGLYGKCIDLETGQCLCDKGYEGKFCNLTSCLTAMVGVEWAVVTAR